MYSINDNGKQLIEIVLHREKVKGYIAWDIETGNYLNATFKETVNAEAWKKRYYRAKHKHKHFFKTINNETVTSKTTYNASTQEYIIEADKFVKEGELITPESIAIEKGYDIRYFEIVSFKHTKSSGTSVKSPTGEWSAEHFSVTVRRRKTVDFTETDLQESLKHFKYKHTPNTIISKKQDSTLIFFFTDTHIGAINQDETWNLAIASETIISVVRKMKDHILLKQPQEVKVVFLGDFINYDNAQRTTTKGTPQINSSNPYHMLDTAINLSHTIVRELCIAENNQVYFLYGNHDKVLSYAMFKPLPYAFSNSHNIKFEINKKERTAFNIGNTAIFLLHGDMPEKRKFDWTYVDYPQIYADSNERYIFQGHLHNLNLRVDTDKGLTLITLPSLQLQSDYEHSQGFANYPLAVGVEISNGLKEIKLFKENKENT